MKFTTPCGLPLSPSLQRIADLMLDGKERTTDEVRQSLPDIPRVRGNLTMLATYGVLLRRINPNAKQGTGMLYIINQNYKPAAPRKNSKYRSVPDYLRVDGARTRGLKRQVLIALNTSATPLTFDELHAITKNGKPSRMVSVLKELRDKGHVKAIQGDAVRWAPGADLPYLEGKNAPAQPEPEQEAEQVGLSVTRFGAVVEEVKPGHRIYRMQNVKTTFDGIGNKPAPMGNLSRSDVYRSWN